VTVTSAAEHCVPQTLRPVGENIGVIVPANFLRTRHRRRS
jgi:hypothetical protein